MTAARRAQRRFVVVVFALGAQGVLFRLTDAGHFGSFNGGMVGVACFFGALAGWQSVNVWRALRRVPPEAPKGGSDGL